MARPSAVIDLLVGSEFGRGFLSGMGATVILSIPSALRRYWGLAWTAGGIAALYWAGGAVIEAAMATATASPWVTPALAAAALVAAKGITSSDSSIAAPGFAITVAGIWATVPDTEAIAVLLGVTGALVWVWWPLELTSPGRLGAWTTTTLLAIGVAAGSSTRSAALVGGLGVLASLGALIFEPRMSPAIVRTLHIGLVLIWSRLAGRMNAGLSAVAVGAALSTVMIFAAVLIPIGRKAGSGTAPGDQDRRE